MAAKPTITEKDRGFKKIINEIKKADRSFTTVGVHDGEENYDDGTSVIEVAIKNEYGDGNIPERSFMRSTFTSEAKNLLMDTRKLFKKIINRQTTLERALGFLGLKIQEAVRAKMENLQSPPNAPSTIAGKPEIGNNPLIHTRKLKRSINHKETIK